MGGRTWGCQINIMQVSKSGALSSDSSKSTDAAQYFEADFLISKEKKHKNTQKKHKKDWRQGRGVWSERVTWSGMWPKNQNHDIARHRHSKRFNAIRMKKKSELDVGNKIQFCRIEIERVAAALRVFTSEWICTVFSNTIAF